MNTTDLFTVTAIPLPRLGWQSGALSELACLILICFAILLAILAYRAKSWTLGVIAFLAAGIAIPVLFLAVSAFILYPVFCLAVIRRRGIGYGVLLLATLLLAPTLLYWRIPRPTPLPPEPLRDATAMVRHIEVVSQIWETDEGGQPLPLPFLLLDLEFTPQGATEPIHVFDRLDSTGLSDLQPGAEVPVLYSVSDPDWARVAGGNRTFARKAMVYLLGFTYSSAAIFTLFLLLIGGIEAALRRFLGRLYPAQDARQTELLERKRNSLLPDDPRRRALDAYLRARGRNS